MRYIKIRYDLLNERYDINTLPENIVLLFDGGGKFFLYDIDKKEVIGFIVFSNDVGRVSSKYKGFGVFLYETAMTYRYPLGLCMSLDGETSKRALNVWKKFSKRADVKSVIDNNIVSTYKKDLSNTMFYYSYGKDKLNNLIEIGRKYMLENDISENDVENMEYSFGEDDIQKDYNPDSHYIKYETDDKKAYADIHKNGDMWYIEYIESKRKGGGTEVIHKIITDAKKQGVKKIQLSTTKFSGYEFFDKMGFEEIDPDKHDPTDIPMILYI
jgi:hypothetical protein